MQLKQIILYKFHILDFNDHPELLKNNNQNLNLRTCEIYKSFMGNPVYCEVIITIVLHILLRIAL